MLMCLKHELPRALGIMHRVSHSKSQGLQADTSGCNLAGAEVQGFHQDPNNRGMNARLSLEQSYKSHSIH